MPAKRKIERCSCDEALHLRRALAAIGRIASNNTHAHSVDDLAQCSNLADQAVRLEPLEGDPVLYDVSRFTADTFVNDDGETEEIL